MRARSLLIAGATALLVGALPTAAVAQETTDDPNDLDRTFVPSAPSGESTSDPATDVDMSTDSLPNTGGGMALAGGAAVAGAALLRRR